MARRWQLTAFGSPSGLVLEDVPTAVAGPQQVVVKLLATDSTYTDILVLKGTYRPVVPLPVTPGQFPRGLNSHDLALDCIGRCLTQCASISVALFLSTAGYCGIGIVSSVGPGCTKLRVGQRVAVIPQRGCAATEILLPEVDVFPVREDIAPTDAVSLVLTGITALQMLTRASNGRLKPEAKLLVHGCMGGTGAMVVEIAKLLGVPAANIIGTCTARNIPIAREKLGIAAIDYSADGGNWPRKVRELTGGRGVDLVFDHILLDGYLSKSIDSCAPGGKVVAFGATNTAAPGSLSVPSMIGAFFRLSLQNFASCVSRRAIAAEFYNIMGRKKAKPQEFVDDLGRLMDWLHEGKLKPVVGRVWPFEGVKEALMAIESNSHNGKQVIRIADA
jgi:NADPH:quinone reductase